MIGPLIINRINFGGDGGKGGQGEVRIGTKKKEV
jgi:hypothetical protein